MTFGSCDFSARHGVADLDLSCDVTPVREPLLGPDQGRRWEDGKERVRPQVFRALTEDFGNSKRPCETQISRWETGELVQKTARSETPNLIPHL